MFHDLDDAKVRGAVLAHSAKEGAAKGVTVFDTYVGAAVEAYKAGLITREGLERVAASAQRELGEISFSQPAQKAARQAELDRDLAAMRALL